MKIKLIVFTVTQQKRQTAICACYMVRLQYVTEVNF